MKCMSSCFSCLCGSRNSARITPSEPIQIIQANAEKHHSQFRKTRENENGTVGGINTDGGRVNPNFNMGDEPDGGDDNAKRDSSSTASSVKALYIEVGKDRLLRVMHIRSTETEESLSPEKSPAKDNNATSPDTHTEEASSSSPAGTAGENNAQQAGADDDEEEYWFSKWARKPRFRSIFAKNPNSRPKISENNNNSMGSSPEENKLSAELEMARAAAAAKRRAWAYNNNGSCESVTQQPTVNLNDEEEFSSIAIVNTTKQQWSKGNTGGSSNNEEKSEEDGEETSPSKAVHVEVPVERHNPNDGISNPAFQLDDDEQREEDELGGDADADKTEIGKRVETGTGGESRMSSGTASVKSRLSSSNSQEEEDAITSEPQDDAKHTTTTTGDGLDDAIPKKPLLFFIHSISSSSDVWHHQMEFFQQLGYEIVAPDLLGHGLSSTPLNPKYYYFESLVQDLILIFDHFASEDTKVVLVGHGYGACLAAMLTRIRLKNVALLISIAGGGPTPLVRRTCCQDSWFAWKCKLFHSNRIRGRFDNPELKHILPPAIHESVLSGQVWADGDSAFYRRVTVPTLLVYGMRDTVVTLVEECEMERTIPKSFLELIDSSAHMVMLDEPEKLNKMLCKFIQSWS